MLKNVAEEQSYAELFSLSAERGGWQLRSDDFWLTASPPGYIAPHEGWKLHTSLDLLSCNSGITAIARFAQDWRLPFKVPANRAVHELINSPRYSLENACKVVTLYVGRLEDARGLVEPLEVALGSVRGPLIPDGESVRVSNRVWLKYGVFASPPQLDQDGVRRRRTSARPPLPQPFGSNALLDVGHKLPALKNGAVLTVSKVLARSNRGVVATADGANTPRVVVKQARSGIGQRPPRGDVRALLQHEYLVLQDLEPMDVLPKPFGIWARENDTLLFEEYLQGEPLDKWADNLTRFSDAGCHDATATRLAEGLSALLEKIATIHHQGYVLRDLNPSNVMVLADGSVRLIDAEAFSRDTEPTWRFVRPGYTAPELLGSHGVVSGATAADVACDVYSFGAIVFRICSRREPPATSSSLSRAAAMLDATHPLLERFQRIAVQCTAPDARARPGLPAVQQAIRSAVKEHGGGRRLAKRSKLVQLRSEGAQALNKFLHDRLADFTSGSWPNPRIDTGEPDVGIALCGVAPALWAALRSDRSPWSLDPEVPREAALRLAREAQAIGTVLPGLLRGHTGTAATLIAAGRTLGLKEVDDLGHSLLWRAPADWHRSGFDNGRAGAAAARVFAIARDSSLKDDLGIQLAHFEHETFRAIQARESHDPLSAEGLEDWIATTWASNTRPSVERSWQVAAISSAIRGGSATTHDEAVRLDYLQSLLEHYGRNAAGSSGGVRLTDQSVSVLLEMPASDCVAGGGLALIAISEYTRSPTRADITAVDLELALWADVLLRIEDDRTGPCHPAGLYAGIATLAKVSQL